MELYQIILNDEDDAKNTVTPIKLNFSLPEPTRCKKSEMYIPFEEESYLKLSIGNFHLNSVMDHTSLDRRNIKNIVENFNAFYPENEIEFDPNIRPYFKDVDFILFIELDTSTREIG